MNERIVALAVKAGVTFDWDPGTDGPEVYFDRQEDFEKFAELIVRECMEVARPFYMGTPEDSIYYVEQAINRIAEHFGVE